VEALSCIEPRLPDPAHVLEQRADALHFADPRTNVPQALFYEVPEIKADEEQSALEHRLAAWLYLEHRLNAGELPQGDERREQWKRLGQGVATELFTAGDIELAETIEGRVNDASNPT
jgi:hypothetical protein